MDIFGTTITAGSMVIQFLGACSEFSSDAKSLKALFEWDLRALKEAQQYFSTARFDDGVQFLEPEDMALLQRTSEYLNYLRRSEIEEMEREIHAWTERLNLRVLSLPKQVRVSIPTAYDSRKGAQHSSVINSGDRLREFLALSSTAKLSRAKNMLLRAPEGLISHIREARDISSLPFQYDGQRIVFCSREVSAKTAPGTPDFETLLSDMGELAAVLSCLDPAIDVRLLKVNYYFYHCDSHQFLFAQTPPYHVDSMMTLQELIKYDPFPSTETNLNERFKVAYKLAEAVFFLHTAGFCHKNITSRSIVIFRQFQSDGGKPSIPGRIDEAYLMGFDLIRGVDAKTYKDGAGSRRDDLSSGSVWDFDVFQHPTRLQGDSSPRYIKAHDVYSLGVVLLEIGFWQPLPKVAGRIDQSNPFSWTEELLRIAPVMRQRVGGRYHRIVEWCLSLSGDDNVKNVEFMKEILDPLEEIVNTLM
ncbi:hypothetical protein F5Y13DRAFT_203053 [Hypoxylon sp. FL1857]|nr:hypothetical protein F5Y13DRAFT_203053 [Hypoxylon sp. FL1857]